MSYQFSKQLSEGSIVLEHPVHGRQIWCTIKVKTEKVCVISGVPLKGKKAYRPATGGGNRMERMSIEAMEEITQRK